MAGASASRYTKDDEPLAADVYVEKIIEAVKANAGKHFGFDIPEIWIEPGRSLVGDAGTTLYTIGSQKEVPGIRKYVAIDGGMSDNIRPALYEAKYEAAVANRMNDACHDTASIAGKCCESEEMPDLGFGNPRSSRRRCARRFLHRCVRLQHGQQLQPHSAPGRRLCRGREAQLVIQRETYEDIVKLDLPLKSKVKQ